MIICHSRIKQKFSGPLKTNSIYFGISFHGAQPTSLDRYLSGFLFHFSKWTVTLLFLLVQILCLNVIKFHKADYAIGRVVGNLIETAKF